MRVDLPAPFSPHSATTSPARTDRLTLSSATTPGNFLPMARIESRGAGILGSLVDNLQAPSPIGWERAGVRGAGVVHLVDSSGRVNHQPFDGWKRLGCYLPSCLFKRAWNSATFSFLILNVGTICR